MAITWGVNNDWGIGDDQVGLGSWKLAYANGLRIARIAVYWNRINPNPSVWNFDALDIDIANARAAGMKIYLNIMWAPPWTNDKNAPTYLPFDAGCSPAKAHKPGGPIEVAFDTTKDYCINAPRIREGAIWGVCSKVLERYWRAISYVGGWNEPESEIFFPPRWQDKEHKFERFRNEIMIPFCDALRFYINRYAPGSGIKVVGPEVGDVAVARTLLEHEDRLQGYSWRSHGGSGLLWDIFSWHPYSWEFVTESDSPTLLFPGGSIKRTIEGFLPAFGPYRRGRAAWIGEVGGNTTSATPEGLAQQAIEQRAFVREMSKISGVDAVLLYRLQRSTLDRADHGLILLDGTPTPALIEIGKEIAAQSAVIPSPTRTRPARRPR